MGDSRNERPSRGKENNMLANKTLKMNLMKRDLREERFVWR